MTSARKSPSRDESLCMGNRPETTWTAAAACVAVVVLACSSGTGAVAASPSSGDGTLVGQYSCNENLSPISRSKAPFTLPIELSVRQGQVTGKREDPQTVDAFSGSMDSSGMLAIELAGSWKDEPSRRWLGRFKGQVRDGAVRATGEMLSPDGRSKLRDCALTLRFVTEQTPPRTSSPGATLPQTPSSTRLPVLPTPQASSPQGSTSPTSRLEQLPPKLVERLEVFRRSLNAVGQDPTRSNERLADDFSDAYDKGHFGNAIENNCRPLDGPFQLEHLGRVLSMRPFQWTPEMASRVEPLWGRFIAACPGYGQLGDAFLAAIRRATEDRASQIAALKARVAKERAESDAAQAREAEQKRIASQQREETVQKARADRERLEAEVRQQRLHDLKSGKVKPASLADAVSLHDARGAFNLVFSPKVGPSTEMFMLRGILHNVIGGTLVVDVGGKMAEVRISDRTIFLGSKLSDLRLKQYIGMVGNYAGMDQNRGETWAVFRASYVEQ